MHNLLKELTGSKMKIQRPNRINSDSVDTDLKPAVDTVGAAANIFMEQTYTAIMGLLGVNDNLNMEFKTIDIIVDASGIPNPTVSFKSGLSGKVVGLTVIRTFLANPTAQPFLNFSENNGIITINYTAGLVPNTKYQLVILSIGG